MTPVEPAYQELSNFEKNIRERLGIDKVLPGATCLDISLLHSTNGAGEQIGHADFHLGNGLVVCLFVDDLAESTRFFAQPQEIRHLLVQSHYESRHLKTKAEYIANVADL